MAAHRLVARGLDLRSWRPERRDLAWLALFAGLFAPHFARRWHYYGWLLPNTFYGKSSGGAGTWIQGLYYLRRFIEDYDLLGLPVLMLLVRPGRDDLPRRAYWRMTTLLVAAYAVYAVKVGGDFMGPCRFILPVGPLLAVAAQEAVRTGGRRLRPGRPVVGVAKPSLKDLPSSPLSACGRTQDSRVFPRT